MMMFPGLRAAATLTCTVVGLSGCVTTAPVRDTAASVPGDSMLVSVASAVETSAPAVAAVWTGYWSPRPPLLLYRTGGPALLLTDAAPDSGDWRPVRNARLPASSRPAFAGGGALPGLVGNFDLAYEVGSLEAVAIPADDSVPATLRTLYHEAFHRYQQEHFAATLGAAALTPLEEPPLDAAVIGAAAFVGMAALDALRAPRSDAPEIVRRYLAVRGARSAAAPVATTASELNVERKEGSAEYVGAYATALAMGVDPDGTVATRAQGLLSVDLDAALGGDVHARNRMRLYGTGLAAAVLLDRLEIPWKQRLEEGASFYGLLAEASGFAEDRVDGAILATTLAEYGFDQIVAATRAPDSDDPVQSFHRLAPYRLVIDTPGLTASPTIESFGGLPAQPEPGLIVMREFGTGRIETDAVVLRIEGLPVLIDMRNPREAVHITVMLEQLPDMVSEARPSIEWPEGGAVIVQGLEFRTTHPSAVSLEGNTMRVRVRRQAPVSNP